MSFNEDRISNGKGGPWRSNCSSSPHGHYRLEWGDNIYSVLTDVRTRSASCERDQLHLWLFIEMLITRSSHAN